MTPLSFSSKFAQIKLLYTSKNPGQVSLATWGLVAYGATGTFTASRPRPIIGLLLHKPKLFDSLFMKYILSVDSLFSLSLVLKDRISKFSNTLPAVILSDGRIPV